MNIKELKEAIKDLPDDMLVGISEGVSEATGMANSIIVCDGTDAPYDKGDNPYQLAEMARRSGQSYRGITKATKIAFVTN